MARSGLRKILSGLKDFTKPELKRRQGGTNQRMALSGTENMPPQLVLEYERMVKLFARNVGNYSQNKQHITNSAQTPASLSKGELTALTTNNESADFAKSSTVLTNTANRLFVQGHVVKSITGVSVGLKKVYDFTVEGEHEYFANGVLVHNCIDSVRYATYSHFFRGD